MLVNATDCQDQRFLQRNLHQLGSRLGLLNRSLYKVAAKTGAYGPIVTGPKGQISGGWFTDITTGDNLGWNAVAGYDVASGLGSINAYNLYTALKAR